MKMLAILAVKNEEYYIKYCLRSLFSQGFDVYIINNDSEDDTNKIAKKYLNKGVVSIENLNTGGVFDLAKMMQLKADIANSYDADWFMHTDADEIRLPHLPYKTMREALPKIDSLGYNAINFHLFNFVPENGKSYVDKDYEKEMRYYYFHSSEPFTQIKLWKKTENQISFGISGGHRVHFDGILIYPNPFILKHYIFLSRDHGILKYTKNRKYLEENVRKYGWHGRMRTHFEESRFHIPDKSQLKRLGEDEVFDLNDPTPVHLFYEEEKTDNGSDPNAKTSVPNPQGEKAINDRTTLNKLTSNINTGYKSNRHLRNLLNTLPKKLRNRIS